MGKEVWMYVAIVPLSIVIATLVLLGIKMIIIKRSNIVSKNYSEDSNIKKMDTLLRVYAKARELRGSGCGVDGFKLETNTLQFNNFSTGKVGGNCFGFVYVTKVVFNNTILKTIKDCYDISFLNDNKLGDFNMDTDTIDMIYGEKDKQLDSNNKDSCYNEDLYCENKEKVIKPSVMYEKIFSMNNRLKNKYPICEKNRDVINIIMAIEYYQYQLDNNIETVDMVKVMPNLYKDKESAMIAIGDYCYSKLRVKGNIRYNRQIDVKKLILDKIDSNELVVIGIESSTIDKHFNGHAVLAYKYEEIDDNTFKVYVYDCNMPLFKEDSKLNTKINNDIKNNTFILFKKIEGIWEYVYMPYINGHYLYNGYYNSYVPNTSIIIL